MKFSIVIPVYKAEEYLDQCVESVLGQTYTDMEVILVDDGSPDRCGAMCDAWAEKDQRIKVIHQENGGAAAARNHGIRYASGDYLLCLDSDDWWDNNTVLGIIASQLKLTPVDVLSFNYRKSYDGVLQLPYFNGSLESSQKSESLEQILKKDVWVSGPCNKAISIRLLKEHDLYFREGVTAEDIDWPLRIALKAESFAFSNVCFFVYRQRSESSSHSISAAKLETLYDNVQFCVQLLEEADPAKTQALKPYAAYQYGTLIYNVANMSKAERRSFLPRIRQMQYLLSCSENPKVRLLHQCSRVLGMPGTMALLRLWSRLQKISGKGG